MYHASYIIHSMTYIIISYKIFHISYIIYNVSIIIYNHGFANFAMCPYVRMYVNFQFIELLTQLKIIFSQSELNNQV